MSAAAATEAVRCGRCGQFLARACGGALYVGDVEIAGRVILHCRICAREQLWPPAESAPVAVSVPVQRSPKWARAA